MSRSYLNTEHGRWRMFCDVCHDHDDRTYDESPDLGIFYADGWFIGMRVDACPECVAHDRLPDDLVHRLYPFPRAAA